MYFSSIVALLVTSSTLALAKCTTCPCRPEPIAEKDDLQIYTYHASPVPLTYQNSTDLSFSPTTFTLIATQSEAVLVDAPISPDRGNELADWIEATVPGRKLTAVYVTHGHGDHFFAIPTIQSRFPGVKILATQEVYDHMLQQIEPEFFTSFWAALFPDLAAPVLSDITILEESNPNLSFHLNSNTGHSQGAHKRTYELRAVEVGEGDTVNSTVLYIPHLKAVVTGDVVYGHCYQYLAENPTAELRAQWIKSIDQIAALRPEVVIPSHALASEGYGKQHLTETKDYIKTFEDLLGETGSWEELEGALVKRFPEREGSFILRYSAQSFFGAAF
ncbi:beta-lactamase-like protein [Aspergillus granulosus]|uniref:Beta-lactamase-like protein n=1 Tax=Aspergillus granulosus TaxID=176169 RepID=A0ABR4H108_9EURO